MSAPLASAILAAFLAAGPTSAPKADSGPRHDFAARGLDANAVAEGLRARVGPKLERWSVEIDSKGGRRYAIDLSGPGGFDDSRELVLVGRTRADRSREMAAALALIIEEASRIHGFVLLEGHLGLGPPRDLDPDLGLGLAGGVWLVQDHLQPRIALRWSHSWAGDLTLHQLSPRLGLAAGTSVGPIWVGGLLMPGIEWTWVRDPNLERVSPILAAGGEASILAQYRHDRLVVGLRTGIETTFPAVRADSGMGAVDWSWVRWLLVLEIGLRI